MASKELIEKITEVVESYTGFYSEEDANQCSVEVIAAIRADILEPTGAMLEAGYAWDEHVTATETHPRSRGLWRSMVSASALGEQSE